jgi:hypothetical protein
MLQFNSGSLMGALIVLGITAQDGQVSTISTGIYLAFLIIMLIGAASTMTILPLHKIVRGDGTAGKFWSTGLGVTSMG